MEYQTDVVVNSKSIIQRGKQVLEVNSTSTVSKISKVIAVDDNDYTFNVKVKSTDNLIDAMGKKLHYNSSSGLDGSTIKNALSYIVNKPVDVKINKYGIIESFNVEKVELATDTLLAFAGIQPEVFKKGKLFDLFADITYTKNLIKGHNWTDVSTTGNEKITTKFWIENVNEKNTILKFTSSSIGKLVNSSSNGTYLVDNKTGLILEKLVYVISLGYQVSAGGIVYGVSRSSSIFERNKLLL
ncbi:hypothetical protein EZ428_03680 [Pedobacter frigiditerrae]|uniref:Uncharacterized protein n=1 Tax=Pedobacter frigiditerrae TaxID=2530452 RepID=A0A4R0N3E2_9SPHI|nr:hypothetical protein [Pedobacter frigiditerrae]TCC93883.1 hypothetical protein EZ428_03680 [Pedobacter frigiditerrae]